MALTRRELMYTIKQIYRDGNQAEYELKVILPTSGVHRFAIRLGEGVCSGVNIPATGTLDPADIPVFSKGLRLAQSIASGEIVLE